MRFKDEHPAGVGITFRSQLLSRANKKGRVIFPCIPLVISWKRESKFLRMTTKILMRELRYVRVTSYHSLHTTGGRIGRGLSIVDLSQRWPR